MREANWDEVFQRRRDETPIVDQRLSAVFPWEDWLTFAIATLVFMSVVASIDSARWVNDMPSLYPIGFSALIVGYAMSRVRRHEFVLHPIALIIGAALVYLQLIAIVPGHTPYVRTEYLVNHMHDWWTAVIHYGISDDTLPFIVLMLVLVWAGAYISSWAIFRWRNAYLGLLPGGIALMWNLSFIPGSEFSFSFLFFIFGAVLLVMRLHVAKKEQAWDDRGICYPEFISLSVLNATFWVTIALFAFVWFVPLADRSSTANQRWQDFTSPITRHFTPFGRVFVSVNAKKAINIHNLKDALALQGKINLTDKQAVTINVKITPEVAAYLREQSYDEYTNNGWKVNIKGDLPLAPGDRTLVNEGSANTGNLDAGSAQAGDTAIPPPRQEVTVNVTVEGGNNEHLFSVGQPLQSDAAAQARVGGDLPDVTSLTPADHLSNGDSYSVTGSVNVASIDQLKFAGDAYPSWVTDRYLALPDSLPARVQLKAQEVARSAATPYEKAAAIEKYLRTFPNDYNVPKTPSGRDSVDYFLFDAQRGYFDYHASAMAVMLRSIGIPARVATGYVIDPLQRDGDSDLYHLTQRNAFAWPEVYFPAIGWVEFSPTPVQPLINRPGSVIAPATGRNSDRNLNPDEPPIDLGISPAGPPNPAATAANNSSSDGWSIWPALIVLGVIALIGATLAGAGKFAWEYGLGGLNRSSQLWEKTLRLSAIGKHGARSHETPREFAARLRRDVPGADAAGYLAASYERNRFGQKQLSDDDAEKLESAWSSLRGALLRRALRLRPRRQL